MLNHFTPRHAPYAFPYGNALLQDVSKNYDRKCKQITDIWSCINGHDLFRDGLLPQFPYSRDLNKQKVPANHPHAVGVYSGTKVIYHIDGSMKTSKWHATAVSTTDHPLYCSEGLVPFGTTVNYLALSPSTELSNDLFLQVLNVLNKWKRPLQGNVFGGEMHFAKSFPLTIQDVSDGILDAYATMSDREVFEDLWSRYKKLTGK